MERTVILGGGYAGAIAASRLAARGIAVTLVEAGEGLVERIRLHQVAAGDDLRPVPYGRLFRNAPVTVMKACVLSIDLAARVVRSSAGDIPYDTLVYALGSTIDDGGVPGVREHALGLRGIAGALQIRERLRAASRIVIVGGGLTAIELAAEIGERYRGLDITVLSGGRIVPGLSHGAEHHVRTVLGRLGVRVVEGVTVVEVNESGVMTREGRLDADLVVWCGGFRPSPIARDAGLEMDAAGRILVDDALRSSDPRIYAIGDAASFRHLGMQCAVALPMGAFVADHIAGVTRAPFSFAYAVTCVSLGRSDGIVQMKNPDGSPREHFVTGRPAAWLKELVCRYAVLSIRMERMGVRYRWPKAIAA